MTGMFADNPGKREVRNSWNTPILNYLNQQYGFRYRYLGLPGVDLIDVILWKNMIDDVIAFQMRDKTTTDDPQGRRSINKLRYNLQLLGLHGYAYFGSFEEVVLKRKDSEGTPYQQGNVITLFNLDFCDEISSPVFTDSEGKQLWRFEAVRHALQDQKDAFQRDGGPSLFVLLVTVRDQMGALKLANYLRGSLLTQTSAYISSCAAQKPIPSLDSNLVGTHTWGLKAFVFDTLSTYLVNPHISAIFFPLIKYTGNRVRVSKNKYLPSPMLHFMVLCKFEGTANPRPQFLPNPYLGPTPSIRAQAGTPFSLEVEPGETAIGSISTDPMNWLTSFENSFLQGVTYSRPTNEDG